MDAGVFTGLTQGTHTIYVDGQDAAGYWSAAASSTFVKDTVGPTITSMVAIATRNTSVATENVTLSETITLTTFTLADLSLTRDGSPVTLTGVTVTLVSGTTYRINNLATLTNTPGNYVLTVDATGISDPAGNAGTGSSQVSWTLDTTAPTVVNVTSGSADGDLYLGNGADHRLVQRERHRDGRAEAGVE